MGISLKNQMAFKSERSIFSRGFIDMTCMKTGSAELLFKKFVGFMLLLLKVGSNLTTSGNITESVRVTLM